MPKAIIFSPFSSYFFLFLLLSSSSFCFISFCNFSYSPLRYWPNNSNSSLDMTPSSFSSNVGFKSIIIFFTNGSHCSLGGSGMSGSLSVQKKQSAQYIKSSNSFSSMNPLPSLSNLFHILSKLALPFRNSVSACLSFFGLFLPLALPISYFVVLVDENLTVQ